MSTNSNTGKKKYFAYVTAPEHVTGELIKLNGIEFNSKCMIVEEAKNKPTAFSEANALRRTSPVFGNHLTDENQSKLSIGSAKKAYSETVRLSPNSSNTLIFTECMNSIDLLKIAKQKCSVFPAHHLTKCSTT